MIVTLGEGNWALGSSAVMKALALCTLCTVWNLLPNGKAIYLNQLLLKLTSPLHTMILESRYSSKFL